jgi:hypothetical protein
VVVRATGEAGFVAEDKRELPELLKGLALDIQRKLNSGGDMIERQSWELFRFPACESRRDPDRAYRFWADGHSRLGSNHLRQLRIRDRPVF